MRPAFAGAMDALRDRPGCDPVSVWASTVGLKSWTCPACAALYSPRAEDHPGGVRPKHDVSGYPPTYCRGELATGRRCGRPVPVRCSTRMCDSVVHPREHPDGTFSAPEAECIRCRTNGRVHAAERQIAASFPERLLVHARSYWALEHRASLDRVMVRWIQDDACGKYGGSPTCIVVHGCPGSGKSAAVAYHCAMALRHDQVPRVQYVTEPQLMDAALAQFDDQDHERRSRARALLAKSKERDALYVFDELGSRTKGYSQREHEELRRAIFNRLDLGLPTVLVTNRGPDADGDHLAWIDRNIASRVAGHAVVVACDGQDLRRKQQRAA